MTNFRKLLSIRIMRNNDKNRRTRNARGWKNVNSLEKQIMHDFRLDDFETGYLLNENMQDQNIYVGVKSDTLEGKLKKTLARAKNLWSKAQDDYQEHNNKKMHGNASPYITGVLSFGREFGQDLTPNQKKKLAHTVKSFIVERFGDIISLAYHQDELSGHFHFSTLNYDFKNHKTHEIDTSLLQDEVSNYLSAAGQDYGYVRGTSKDAKKGNTKHLDILQAKHEYSKELDETIGELTKELKSKVQELIDLTGNDDWSKKLRTGLKYADRGQSERLQTLLDKLDTVKVPTKPITPPVFKPRF